MEPTNFTQNPTEGTYILCKIERVDKRTNTIMVSYGEKNEDGSSSFKQTPIFLSEEQINAIQGFLGKDDSETIKGSNIYCYFNGDTVIQLMNLQERTFREYLSGQKPT